MRGVAFHRPVRALPPAIPDERVTLPAVPQEPRSASGSSAMTLAMPVMSSVMMAGYMISYGKPLLIAIGVVFVVGSIASGLVMRHQMRKGTRKNKAVLRAAQRPPGRGVLVRRQPPVLIQVATTEGQAEKNADG